MSDDLIQRLITELEESKQRDRDVINIMQANIKTLNKLLIGNGEIGLCERVRTIQASVKPLWVMVATIGTAILAFIVKSFLGGA